MMLPAWARFRAGYGDGYGLGDGDGSGFGFGAGYGDGFGFGDGFGCGDGDGVGYGDGHGDGNGDGNGDGSPYRIEIGDWEIAVGCQRMTARAWLDHGMEIAAKHDYPAVAVPAMRALVEAQL